MLLHEAATGDRFPLAAIMGHLADLARKRGPTACWSGTGGSCSSAPRPRSATGAASRRRSLCAHHCGVEHDVDKLRTVADLRPLVPGDRRGPCGDGPRGGKVRLGRISRPAPLQDDRTGGIPPGDAPGHRGGASLPTGNRGTPGTAPDRVPRADRWAGFSQSQHLSRHSIRKNPSAWGADPGPQLDGRPGGGRRRRRCLIVAALDGVEVRFRLAPVAVLRIPAVPPPTQGEVRSSHAGAGTGVPTHLRCSDREDPTRARLHRGG
jgi:hypothetical protein